MHNRSLTSLWWKKCFCEILSMPMENPMLFKNSNFIIRHPSDFMSDFIVVIMSWESIKRLVHSSQSSNSAILITFNESQESQFLILCCQVCVENIMKNFNKVQLVHQLTQKFHSSESSSWYLSCDSTLSSKCHCPSKREKIFPTRVVVIDYNVSHRK